MGGLARWKVPPKERDGHCAALDAATGALTAASCDTPREYLCGEGDPRDSGRLRAETKSTRWSPLDGGIEAFEMRAEIRVRPEELFERYWRDFGLRPCVDALTQMPASAPGSPVYFAQTNLGVPLNSGFVIHTRSDGFVDSANGHVYPGQLADVTPRVDATTARAHAYAYVHVPIDARDQGSLTLIQPELRVGGRVMPPLDGYRRLAWIFRPTGLIVVVDAKEGRVLRTQSTIDDGPGGPAPEWLPGPPGRIVFDGRWDVEAFIDGHWIGRTRGTDTFATPGHHTVTLRRDGATATQSIEIAPLTREVVRVTL